MINAYYTGLKDNVKDEISRIEESPVNFNTLVEKSIKIDNRAYEQVLEKKGIG